MLNRLLLTCAVCVWYPIRTQNTHPNTMGCEMSVPTVIDETLDSLNGQTAPQGRIPIDKVVHNAAERKKHVRTSLSNFHKSEQNMKREELGAFKDIQKRRVMAECINSFKNPSGEPFVLICDTLGTHLLSTQVDMTEIMFPSGPVCMVEKLGCVRQPMPDMEAVYFIEPHFDSLRHLIGDFASKDSHGKPRSEWVKGDELYVPGQIGARSPDAQYKGVHLLFTGELQPGHVKVIQSCPELLRHLITFRESRLFFFPLESHVINFGMTNSLNRVYGYDKINSNNQVSQQLYDDVADKMLGVCVSLHELPIVRMLNKNPRSKPVVELFCQKMNKHVRENCTGSEEDTWWYHEPSIKDQPHQLPDRATLLMFDRAEDLSSPLMHEFTYQAMAMDTLSEDIVVGLGQTSFEYKVQEGKQETTMLFNNDKDEIWRLNRHKHIADLAQALEIWEKKFLQRDDYKLLMKHKDGQLTRPKDQLKLMRTGQDTAKTMEEYKRHRSVATKLIAAGLKKYDQDDTPLMFTICEVEGQIATGIDGSGRTVSDDKVRQNLMKLLNRFEVDMEQKKRLLTLWFIHMGYKYPKLKHDKIFEACQPELGTAEKLVIGHLTYLSIPMHDFKRTKEEKKIRENERTLAQKRAKELQEKNTSATRTHEPKLVSIVARHIEMTLKQNEYPWRDPLVAEMPEEMGISAEPRWYTSKNHGKKKSLSARKKPNGLRKNHKNKFNSNSMNLDSIQTKVNSNESKGQDDKPNVREPGFKFFGSRIIVCVFGGVTYSELRGLYDLMESTKREIIICATDIITPAYFLKELANMGHQSRESVDEDDIEEKHTADDFDLDITDGI